MFASKIRWAGWCALIGILAGYALLSSWKGDAQEPAKLQVKESKLKELLKERLATTQKLVEQTAQRVKNASGTVEELLAATRLAHEAALELCASDKERVQVLESYLAAAKDNERFATQFHKTGQGRETTALAAKAERLRVEIALERVRGKKNGGGPIPPPKKGTVQKVSTQPCTLEAFESVRLFTPVSGFLKEQRVDIGQSVKRGDVLAVIDVPELEAQLRHDQAGVNRARAQLMLAKARIITAKANLDTLKLQVAQAEANAKSAAAFLQYREKQWKRMKELFDAGNIVEKLLEETKEHYQSAVETERVAKAAIATAKAQWIVGQTKIDQVEADVLTTEADIKLTQAQLEKSKVLLNFATIRAPLDGIIAQRGYFPGDFILAADKGGRKEPLFTVQRIDLMRVVTAIPDRDVPFVSVGNPAEVNIEALPGKKWTAKVSRMAVSLDPQTSCLRVELDLLNTNGKLRPGMFGKVSIALDK